MKSIALALLPLGLFACTPDTTGQGTAVGNVSSFRVSTPTASDVASVTGQMHVTEAALVDCDGGSSEIAAGVALSLVGGSTLGVPDGVWCGVSLTTDQPAVWTGASSAGFSFSIAVAVNRLTVSSATPFDASTELALVWQLGRTEWLNAKDLGADDEDVDILSDDSEARKALQDITSGQFMFDDEDDDLRADDDEDDLSTAEDEREDHSGSDDDTDVVRARP